MDYMKYFTIQVIKKSERSEVVFAALDEMDVPVVVKRLLGANPEIYREIAKIRNPHIPWIYCVEEQGDELFVAEEYIDGRTLDVYLAEESLTDLQKLELMMQLCEALEVLHRCNPPVIHRDIKPSNILITGDGVLKVIDFDASRQYKEEKDTGDTRLLGTIEYAAPEQFGYSQTDVRSDIYSAGVVFSEIAIDKDAAFAKEWKRLVDKCTSFDPENRYDSVTQLKKSLVRCIEKSKRKSKAKKRAIAGIWVAGLLLIFGVLLTRMIWQEEEINSTKESVDATQAVQTEVGKVMPPEAEDVVPSEGELVDGVVFVQDRFTRTHESEDVLICTLRSDADCGIKEVFLCEQREKETLFSEELYSLEPSLYDISLDGHELRLGTGFFDTQKEKESSTLFIEFNDGYGEKVWISYGSQENQVLPKDGKEDSTGQFLYKESEDGKVVVTGVTQECMADRSNRKLMIPETIDGMQVTSIAEGAFAGLPLREVILSEGLLEIGKGAFYGCNLKEIVIPATVKYIAPRAFGANYSMKKIEVAEDNLVYCSKSGVLYDKNMTTLYQMPAGFRDVRFTVPTHVKVLGEYAFGNCRNVEAFHMESAVEERKDVFWNTAGERSEKDILAKKIVGRKTEEVWNSFTWHTPVDSFFVSSELNFNGAYSLRFERCYGELILECPNWIEMQHCAGVRLKLKNEVGDIVVKFYDTDFQEVYSFEPGKTEGVEEIWFYPELTQRVAKVGFAAKDRTLTNYDSFETILYSMVYQFVNPEDKHIAYDFSEMVYEESDGVTYTIDEVGALVAEYDKVYGDIVFRLPAPVDMAQCTAVSMKIKNEAGNFGLRLYNEKMEEVDSWYGDERNGGMQEQLYSPKSKEKVFFIELLSSDDELMDYSSYAVTVDHIRFFMDGENADTQNDITKTTYRMDDLEFDCCYYADYAMNSDGSISIEYQLMYGALIMYFPEPVALENCDRISVKLQNGEGTLAFKLYDSEDNKIYSDYDIRMSGAGEYSFSPKSDAEAVKFSLMACDGELTDYASFCTKIESITFHWVR